MRSLALTVTALAALGASLNAVAAAPPPPDPAVAANAAVVGAETQVREAADAVELVEKQYLDRPEEAPEARLARRFSEAEVLYVLKDYQSAIVLFSDLVNSDAFRASRSYPDALLELADALHQSKNPLGAASYYRKLLKLGGPRFLDGLANYLPIATQLKNPTGVDGWMATARRLTGDKLPAELRYAFAKWLFSRDDLPASERISRSLQLFEELERNDMGLFKVQAAYFQGVAFALTREWNKAVECFERVVSATGNDPRLPTLRELAQLSIARVYFETDRLPEALARYQTIQRTSDSYAEALFEAAWAYVRDGDLVAARGTTEVLLMVSDGSVLEPEGRILQGTLLEKLDQPDQAIDTFNQVTATYGPASDAIDALLAKSGDPVAYYDDLIARGGGRLDVAKLLPAAAQPWMNSGESFATAAQISAALEQSRAGIAEVGELATRILKALDERGIASFPVLAEGYGRADAVETAIASAEDRLIAAEEAVAANRLGGEAAQRLRDAHASVETLRTRIRAMPATFAERKAQQARFQQGLDALDRRVFQIQIEVSSLQSQLQALQTLLHDNPATRTARADLNRELDGAAAELSALAVEARRLKEDLAGEHTAVAMFVEGDEQLRAEFEGALVRQRAILAEALADLPPERAQVFRRAEAALADGADIARRARRAKDSFRRTAARRSADFRVQVAAQRAIADGYAQEADAIGDTSRHLVGEIAVNSFKRLRRQFHDLMLKADVGIVDVAFARKQEKSDQIQKLALRKEQELSELDRQFKGNLKDGH